MKRLMMGLAALGLVLAIQQQASAWSKFRFSIGMNISWEGAGNSVLGGLLKGSQVPGMGMDGGCMAPGAAMPYGPYGSGGPPPHAAATQPSSAQPVGYFFNQQDGGAQYGQVPGYWSNSAPQAPSYWYER
jgi:hypothetical protein